MKRKKPKLSSKPTPQIISNKLDSNRQLIISYRYLDLQNSKYDMNSISDNRTLLQFYNDFHKKMIEYGKHEDFKKYICENGLYRDRNHIHKIDWKDTKIKESSFTCLEPELMEQIKDDCWQLGINNNGFRIHGFFIEKLC